MESARKSLFECFAYSKKRKGVMVFNAANQSEHDGGVEKGTTLTPNKDHPITRVPETPDSVIRVTACKELKKHQRRCARISSSSEDDLVALGRPAAAIFGVNSANLDRGLFCELPITKRSKKEVQSMRNEPFNIPRGKVRVRDRDMDPWDRNEQRNRPKKVLKQLFSSTEDDTDYSEGECISSSRNCKLRRRQTCFVDPSSDSSEDLPVVSVTSGKV